MIVTLRNRQAEYVTQAEFSDFKEDMYSFRDETYERFDNMQSYMDTRFSQIDARFGQIDARFSHIDVRFKEQRNELYEYIDRRFREQRIELNADYERHAGMVVEQFRHELQLALEFLKPMAEAFSKGQLAIIKQ